MITHRPQENKITINCLGHQRVQFSSLHYELIFNIFPSSPPEPGKHAKQKRKIPHVPVNHEKR